MTAIAYSDGILAGDRQMTEYDVCVGHVQKVRLAVGGRIAYGVAGSSTAYEWWPAAIAKYFADIDPNDYGATLAIHNIMREMYYNLLESPPSASKETSIIITDGTSAIRFSDGSPEIEVNDSKAFLVLGVRSFMIPLLVTGTTVVNTVKYAATHALSCGFPVDVATFNVFDGKFYFDTYKD